MAPDAVLMLASQLRRDPNPDAIEDAAAALEALAIGGERLPGAAFLDLPAGDIQAGRHVRAILDDLARDMLVHAGREAGPDE